MLFIFNDVANHPFWMKNTVIPLDIIWIDSSRKISFIQMNAIPFSETPIFPSGNSKWVLEVRAGATKKYHFKVGDPVTIAL